MRIVDEFPCTVTVIDPAWIELPDGCRLAARILLPDDALARPVPAILEYLPYRRRDSMHLDRQLHHYLAGHGYAAVRVDIRGTGDSDGHLADEYAVQEQDDALAVIAWLAAQSWCTGKVGMFGKSWGGFNALQVAARRPPALRAIVTAYSTDDRYLDECHWMGGCLLTNTLGWGASFFTMMGLPPDPAIVGERWRAMWRERLAGQELFIEPWIRHVRQDDYWRQGSVATDYGAIEAAVLAIGGWADGYTNAVARLVENLTAPCKGLIGPWAHDWPHDVRPGPTIGYLQENLRWWDHWLKDVDNGVMAGPRLRAWLQDAASPATTYEERPGRWVGMARRPEPTLSLRLHERGLGNARSDATVVIRSPLSTGIMAGEWCPYGLPGELPDDQRIDDGRSAVFDTTPLLEPLDLLGTPRLTVALAADRSSGMLAARLVALAPDGAATLLSVGLCNLRRRFGFDRDDPLEPDERFVVSLPLNDLGERIPAGHRLRLALSTVYWPMAWPMPEPTTLRLFLDEARLALPVLAHGAADWTQPDLGLPEQAATMPFERLQPPARSRMLQLDPTTGRAEVQVRREHGMVQLTADDRRFGDRAVERYVVTDGQPLSASAELSRHASWQGAGIDVRVESVVRLGCAGEAAFLLEAELRAFEADVLVSDRRWSTTIPRDGA